MIFCYTFTSCPVGDLMQFPTWEFPDLPREGPVMETVQGQGTLSNAVNLTGSLDSPQ